MEFSYLLQLRQNGGSPSRHTNIVSQTLQHTDIVSQTLQHTDIVSQTLQHTNIVSQTLQHTNIMSQNQHFKLIKAVTGTFTVVAVNSKCAQLTPICKY